nr:C-type lectin domain family 4 member E-like [Biomphalaria glabrata]
MSLFVLFVFFGIIDFGEQIVFNANFYRITNTNYTIWTDKASITVRRRLDCASKCLMTERCKAVTYVKKTGSCTLGFCAQYTSIARSPADELYQTQLEKCNSNPGFSYWSYGNTGACLWQSTDKLSFATAKLSCAAKGAVLFTLKSVDKLHLAQMFSYRYYVGLNDLQTEGTFVFDADNTVLDESLKTQLFQADQPDNYLGIEDCVVYVDWAQRINDVPCYYAEYYICEIFCFML